ncbi:MAG: hypothetical protein QM749_17475 [Aquabacterium sp.]
MNWIDHEHLLEVSGRIEAVLYNDHGEVDGLLLEGEQEVHVPPHLTAKAGRSLAAGELVTARYVKPRDADVFVALSLKLPSGKLLIDEGPHGHAPSASPAKTAVHVKGTVRSLIHAPRGEVSGALLDGAIVRFHPKGNEDIAACFEPGALVEVWGEGFKKRGVLVIELGHVAQLP